MTICISAGKNRSCSMAVRTLGSARSQDLGGRSESEWFRKWLFREILDASARLIVVHGGDPHTKSTLLGSMLAAAQIRSKREQGSLSRMSEWTKVTEVGSGVSLSVEIRGSVNSAPISQAFCL